MTLSKASLLLDTHILVRWLQEPRRLSREQRRVIENAERHSQPLAISAMTLLEMAVLRESDPKKPQETMALFADLDDLAELTILPITTTIAREVHALGPSLRDPGDRTIVATARVHGLRLLTSDDRIVKSMLVSTIS